MQNIRLLAIVALIGSILWAFYDPGFEPYLAIISSLSALISTYVIEKKRERRSQQNQSVSRSSIGIQAGGDISLNVNRDDKNEK